MNITDFTGYLPIIGIGLLVIIAIAAHRLVLSLFGVIMIPSNGMGVIYKKFVVAGKNKNLPDGAIVAMNGEPGLQADTLAPGVHFGFFPWQYSVKVQQFVEVQDGHVGVVEARDGRVIPAGRVLAKHVDCDSFQNARAFLTSGGERGPQISIIPPGTYRINLGLFTVAEEKCVEIGDNEVGIVTTREGRPLETGDIAGRQVPGHNLFQDGQAFINAGGYKGLQEQVILAGRYYLNPMLATVEEKEMTMVPIAHAGVVIAYVGETGQDQTGVSFKHGNIVLRGQKGVWMDPLDPGKYAINTYTHKVELVPTANVVLNWATGKTESHKLDQNLSTITVRSCDGFKFNLDVSQIIHIPRNDAPRVIARFGNMQNLVTQVLEPTIGNYFRNAAQGSDVIEFLKQRRERQDEARESIGKALTEYNVVAVDTLIGDITPPEALMKTLTDRKIADQERVTFDIQRQAQENRQQLQQATAIADTQAQVVATQRTVEIQGFAAQAAIKTAEGAASAMKLRVGAEAESTRMRAGADAEATRMTGAADAEKTLKIGSAEADVIKMKIASMEAGNYAIVQVAEALSTATVKWTPDIVVGGGAGNGHGESTLANVLLAGLMRDSLLNKGVAGA